MIYTRSCVACTGCDLFAQMQHEDLISRAIVNLTIVNDVRFAGFNYRSSSFAALVSFFFFFSSRNSAQGRTSKRPDISVIDRKHVGRNEEDGFAFLGLFIQNESCPIKRDITCVLLLFIRRYVFFDILPLAKSGNTSSFERISLFIVNNILTLNLAKLIIISWNYNERFKLKNNILLEELNI